MACSPKTRLHDGIYPVPGLAGWDLHELLREPGKKKEKEGERKDSKARKEDLGNEIISMNFPGKRTQDLESGGRKSPISNLP